MNIILPKDITSFVLLKGSAVQNLPKVLNRVEIWCLRWAIAYDSHHFTSNHWVTPPVPMAFTLFLHSFIQVYSGFPLISHPSLTQLSTFIHYPWGNPSLDMMPHLQNRFCKIYSNWQTAMRCIFMYIYLPTSTDLFHLMVHHIIAIMRLEI